MPEKLRASASFGLDFKSLLLSGFALLPVVSLFAQAQQTPPLYVLSNSQPTVTISDDVIIDLLDQGLSPSQFTAFELDTPPISSSGPSFIDTGSLARAPLIGIMDTFIASGLSPTDIRSISAQPSIGVTCQPSFEIKTTIPTKITKVESATLSFPLRRKEDALSFSQDCLGWIETLSIETTLVLDEGVIRDDFATKLGFQNAVDFTVRGKGNKYLIKQDASPTDIDLVLESNSDLFIGERPYVSTLETTLSNPTDSSLTMEPGSSLLICIQD